MRSCRIVENKDGVSINGVLQPNVVDLQVKKNLHQVMEVQVTYEATEFLKEELGDGSGD